MARSDGQGFLNQKKGLTFLENAGVSSHDFELILIDGKYGDHLLKWAFVHWTLVSFCNENFLKKIELDNKFLRNWSRTVPGYKILSDLWLTQDIES